MMKTSLLSKPVLQAWQAAIITIARQAGLVIMEHYQQITPPDFKQDGSPVTIADQAAEALIVAALTILSPDIPIIGEELMAEGRQPTAYNEKQPFWLVDALDGTKEYLRRNGEFTVNIALIVDQKPILGVIYAPALDEEYYGLVGNGAFARFGDSPAQPITCSPIRLSDGVRIVASRSHATPEQLASFLVDVPLRDLSSRGSSLKFCDVAAGRADFYPRFGPTCEWDTAAGQAILTAAGGSMTKLEGSQFHYGKTSVSFLNGGFIASGFSTNDHQKFIKKSIG
jgi:3'(2'), 5'-bisphosphate nucleotidase